MKVSGKNISMTRGDTESITVSFDGYELGDGDVVEMTVRKRANSPTVELHKTATEFEDNKAIFRISSADTSGMSFGSYVYDVQLTTRDGAVITVVQPSGFIVTQEVTYNG